MIRVRPPLWKWTEVLVACRLPVVSAINRARHSHAAASHGKMLKFTVPVRDIKTKRLNQEYDKADCTCSTYATADKYKYVD